MTPGTVAARRAAIEDAMQCIVDLTDIFTPTGALLAMTLPNKHLGGETALDVIAAGQTDRVHQWIESARAGAAT